jgi:hypothetical protein
VSEDSISDINAEFWSEYLKKRNHSEDLSLHRKIILELILGNRKVWTGFMWLRIDTSGGLL